MKKIGKEVLQILSFSLIVVLVALVLICSCAMMRVRRSKEPRLGRKQVAEKMANEYLELRTTLDTLNQNIQELTAALQSGIATSEQTVQMRLGDIQKAIAGIKKQSNRFK
ncbi:MAG: hypothetical protein MZV49_09295 [Rhodopseudomonas palustris]|nr:hypothetical protein [Rhodopseudomonas palustris]